MWHSLSEYNICVFSQHDCMHLRDCRSTQDFHTPRLAAQCLECERDARFIIIARSRRSSTMRVCEYESRLWTVRKVRGRDDDDDCATDCVQTRELLNGAFRRYIALGIDIHLPLDIWKWQNLTINQTNLFEKHVDFRWKLPINRMRSHAIGNWFRSKKYINRLCEYFRWHGNACISIPCNLPYIII